MDFDTPAIEMSQNVDNTCSYISYALYTETCVRTALTLLRVLLEQYSGADYRTIYDNDVDLEQPSHNAITSSRMAT